MPLFEASGCRRRHGMHGGRRITCTRRYRALVERSFPREFWQGRPVIPAHWSRLFRWVESCHAQVRSNPVRCQMLRCGGHLAPVGNQALSAVPMRAAGPSVVTGGVLPPAQREWRRVSSSEYVAAGYAPRDGRPALDDRSAKGADGEDGPSEQPDAVLDYGPNHSSHP